MPHVGQDTHYGGPLLPPSQGVQTDRLVITVMMMVVVRRWRRMWIRRRRQEKSLFSLPQAVKLGGASPPLRAERGDPYPPWARPLHEVHQVGEDALWGCHRRRRVILLASSHDELLIWNHKLVVRVQPVGQEAALLLPEEVLQLPHRGESGNHPEATG